MPLPYTGFAMTESLPQEILPSFGVADGADLHAGFGQAPLWYADASMMRRMENRTCTVREAVEFLKSEDPPIVLEYNAGMNHFAYWRRQRLADGGHAHECEWLEHPKAPPRGVKRGHAGADEEGGSSSADPPGGGKRTRGGRL